MSISSTKKTDAQQLKLFKAAFVSAAVNSPLATNSFTSVADINISALDPDKVVVFVYGHRLDAGNDYATIPNQGTLALIDLANVLLAGYKISGQTVSIGYFSPNPGFTPASPYTTVYLSYFIFTH